ncbi:hypothetical protein [Facklamia hominis]|uniref:Uncharacterized protein n=1 Tax=Facklamia hominis CCUG 36813 TaxID=883111 RepID=K1MBL3_9LACT|nr:hypothetical protein [Facklamia hominis]EKB53409.1 hypothetical protein HMPREF9706_01667 [Facklamia hominis CCUG 36813]
MKSHQKGMVLPCVLVFMVISHLIYLSLCQLNQLQHQRITQFKAYYQSQLQNELLSEKLIQEQDQSFQQGFIQDLTKNIQNIHQTSLRRYQISTLAKSPSVQIGFLSLTEPDQVLIYCIQIYPEWLPDTLNPEFPYNFTGIVSNKGFIDEKPLEEESDYQSLKHSLQEAGYQSVQEYGLRRRYQYQESGLQGYFSFNTGQCLLETNPTNKRQIIYFQVNHPHLTRKEEYPLRTNSYILYWRAEKMRLDDISIKE